MSVDKASRERFPTMDWGQVVANGGPPCFHVERGMFCGRTEEWQGHFGEPVFHHYVSLKDYVQALERETREHCAEIAEAHNNEHIGNYEYKNCGLKIAQEIRRG